MMQIFFQLNVTKQTEHCNAANANYHLGDKPTLCKKRSPIVAFYTWSFRVLDSTFSKQRVYSIWQTWIKTSIWFL